MPDRLIGKILKTFVKELRTGAKVVKLDAAAPHAGELPERDDITYFVTDSQYAECEAIAREIYKPVMRAHRCTVEELAILEPALSDTVGATFALALGEATDEAVRRGVPKQAAIDFTIGHLNIELAIASGIFPKGKFSDGALQAIDNGEAGHLPRRVARSRFCPGGCA